MAKKKITDDDRLKSFFQEAKKVVLIAGIGTSPGVLTETVWALAHGASPTVPDEVVVITTKAGKLKIHQELLNGEQSVWNEMKTSLAKERIPVEGKLRFGDAFIKVMSDADGNEADDLRSVEDNMRAADDMLATLRQYTENDSYEVLCSIAGGRKTMSALLLNCMGLLGRDCDKVFHVLTTPDAIAFSPKFYFPKDGAEHVYRVGGEEKRIAAGKVKIELFEVPFVRIRGWFQEKFKSLPPSFCDLVRQVQRVAPAAALPPPMIEIDAAKGIVRIDGRRCEMSCNCLALLCLLFSGIYKIKDQCEKMLALPKVNLSDPMKVPDWGNNLQSSGRLTSIGDEKEDAKIVSKIANDLRKALAKSGLSEENINRIAPKRNSSGDYPKNRITVIGAESLQELKPLLFPKYTAEG